MVGKENLSACRMADKASVCACLEVLVAHIGCDCRSTVHQPSSGFKIADGKKVVPDEEVGYDFMLSMFRGVFSLTLPISVAILLIKSFLQ